MLFNKLTQRRRLPLATGASLRCACPRNSAATSLAFALVVCLVDFLNR